ncbi:hypothetical protein KHQ81_06155 [Mycoplasmatota bacterium]|nr:hypothetical protein KHQ81_06155 [Mycoplasmatota bacterium]
MVLSEKINNVVNRTIVSTDNIYYTYDVDETLISINYKGQEYFYIRNIQNDVVKIIDITGKVVVTYSCNA